MQQVRLIGILQEINESKREHIPAMNLRETLKKQGGMKLLVQYWKGGSFFTAVGEFLLLGKSRTALEILRLSASLKTKQKLEKKYKQVLLAFDEKYKKQN